MRVHARVMLVLSLVVVFGSPAFGATILLISDSKAPGVEPLHADHEDDPLVAQLQSFGHTVDTSGMDKAFQGNYWDTPAYLAAIAAADLVVVSRRTNSGAYDKEPQWNEITKPLILMSGYLTRSSRWGWTSSGSGNAAVTTTDMVIEAGQAGHAFFAGLGSSTLFDWSTAPTPGSGPKPVYIPDTGTADEGVLLAQFGGRPFMIDIPAGTDLGGDANTPNFGVTAARRVLLPTWGYDDGTVFKFRDFHTGDYDKLFENVVTEMLIPEPATMSLLALGGLAMLRRRRRRA